VILPRVEVDHAEARTPQRIQRAAFRRKSIFTLSWYDATAFEQFEF
jgi:hypothetical protein